VKRASLTLSLTCGNCGHVTSAELPVSSPLLGALVPTPPAPRNPKSTCACGHEFAEHPEGGPCRRCAKGNALGTPPCPRFHTRALRDAKPKARLASDPADEALSRYGRKLLVALAQLGTANRTRLSLMSGCSIQSSEFVPQLNALVDADLVEDRGDEYAITDLGRRTVGHVDALPIGSDAVGFWSAKLGAASGTMLQAFAATFPAALDRRELAQATGYSMTSSSFVPALHKLRDMGLIEKVAFYSGKTGDAWQASRALMVHR
jgi:hypothetical protein